MVIGQGSTVSRRGQLAPPSPIRKLTPLANQAKARGISVLHVNIGQPDISTPSAIRDAIRAYNDPVIAYAPSHGCPETIAAWCTYYGTHGYRVTNEQVIVTTGGSEALWFAFMAVGDPGDEVLILEPTYANYFGFGACTGVKPVAVGTSSADGFHLPDRHTIESAITSRTKAICIANPNNPTGTVLDAKEVQTLVDIAVDRDLFLISDETYRELIFDGIGHVGMLGFTDPPIADRVIVVDSVSKRFSATGMRVGCVVSRNPEVMEAISRFAQARLSSPIVEQLAVIPLLSDPTDYTTWLCAEYQQRRDTVYRGLTQAGIACRKPEGAFYIMVDLPVDDSDRFARWLLSDFNSEGETVMVAPGAGFYVTPGLGRQQARIAYVLNEERLLRAVEILSDAVQAYPGRTS
jgi:aspartate aminotransferase